MANIPVLPGAGDFKPPLDASQKGNSDSTTADNLVSKMTPIQSSERDSCHSKIGTKANVHISKRNAGDKNKKEKEKLRLELFKNGLKNENYEYTVDELNDALKTLFGEASFKCPDAEAEAIVSTMLNRQVLIYRARQLEKIALEKMTIAQKNATEAKKHNVDATKERDNEKSRQLMVRAQRLMSEDPKFTVAQETLQAAKDLKGGASSWINAENRDSETVTLTFVVKAMPDGMVQYEGYKPGSEKYEREKDDPPRKVYDHWENIKKALKNTVENPDRTKPYPYIEFRNEPPKDPTTQYVTIGGNSFRKHLMTYARKKIKQYKGNPAKQKRYIVWAFSADYLLKDGVAGSYEKIYKDAETTPEELAKRLSGTAYAF